MWRFEVSHREYGTTVVESVGAESAIMAACKIWGADWSSEAAYCRVNKLGTADKPRCRRCHREYGEAGDPAALCPACVETLEAYRRDMMRYRPRRTDRRVRDREEDGI